MSGDLSKGLLQSDNQILDLCTKKGIIEAITIIDLNFFDRYLITDLKQEDHNGEQVGTDMVRKG